MKCSGKMVVAMMGILLSSSVGFGAMQLSDIDGNVNPALYDVIRDDTPNETTKDFYNSGSDIAALHWGTAQGPNFATDPTDVWYTLGMTVVQPAINTTGDGTSPFPSFPTVQIGISQGVPDVNVYGVHAMMYGGNVLQVMLTDYVTPAGPVVLDSSVLKASVGSGLEIAIKANQFQHLAPANFMFDLHFEGGGENDDDRIQGEIPEPATMSMLMIGGLVTLARRRRKRTA